MTLREYRTEDALVAQADRARADRDAGRPSGPPPLATLATIADALVAQADRARADRDAGRPGGPVTGFGGLDRAIGGYLAPGLHVLHGAPGAGKTSLALHVAVACGTPALIVTCEMAGVEVARRMVAMVTATPLRHLRDGTLDGAAVRDPARQAAGRAPHVAILDGTTGAPGVAAIADALAALRRDLACRPAPFDLDAGALIVVDSGHAWASGLDDGDALTEYERLSSAVAALSDLAHMTDAAVLVTAERNRASMRQGGMSAAAGTRAWEYRAETVLDLATDDDLLGGATGATNVRLRIFKNRHGPALPGGVPLTFDGRRQRWGVGRG